jgi:GNAT superfamily N-acetyltransferase
MPVVVPLHAKKDLKAFVDFPHQLYKYDPCYVPELYVAQKQMLLADHHPFHEHSDVQLFLAYQNNKVVGRIAAIHNRNHNLFNRSNDGCFGFFEVIEDYDVAEALLSSALSWLKAQGLDTMMGPLNFSTNETCGALMYGFDLPPVAMMCYNPPYYLQFLESFGMTKKVDLWAYLLREEQLKDKSTRLLQPLEKRLKNKSIIIRKVNLKNFDKEVDAILQVYNSAWSKNLGFVPMTEKEFRYLARNMKHIIDDDFCLVAEHEGKMVGFALCIPDVNEVLIKVKNGRLFPFGLFKLLYHRKNIKKLRVVALGVLEQYRKSGIEACFYGRIILKGREKKIRTAEASWVLENNDMMNLAAQKMGGEVYKKYRIYQKAI